MNKTQPKTQESFKKNPRKNHQQHKNPPRIHRPKTIKKHTFSQFLLFTNLSKLLQTDQRRSETIENTWNSSKKIKTIKKIENDQKWSKWSKTIKDFEKRSKVIKKVEKRSKIFLIFIYKEVNQDNLKPFWIDFGTSKDIFQIFRAQTSKQFL